MKVLVFVLLIMSSSVLARPKAERFYMRGEVGSISAEENGNFSQLEAEYLRFKRFSVGMFMQNENRIFNQRGKVEDSRVGILGSINLPNSWSLKWRAAVGQEENIYATWSGQGEFHFKWKKYDVLLGLTHNDYQDMGLIQEGAAGLSYHHNKYLRLAGKLNVLNTKPTANNLELKGFYRFKGLEYELTYQVGKVVEADNVLGDTNSYDFKMYYNSNLGKMRYKIGPALQLYDGTIRDETRIYFHFLSLF